MTKYYISGKDVEEYIGYRPKKALKDKVFVLAKLDDPTIIRKNKSFITREQRAKRSLFKTEKIT